jgi:flagellar motor protein MotB
MEYLANRRKRGSTSDGNIVAMLSLKLLLLAFFILLSTMSSFEEKRSRAVLESVATTFEGHVAAIRSLDNPAAGLGQLENAPSLVDQLKSLFRQTLPVVEMEESPTGNALRLEVPADSVFVAGSARLAPGRGVLLDRLARILNGEDGPEAAYELQLLHSVRGSGDEAAGELAVQRGGVMARRLSDLGVARDSLSIALWPRAPEAAGDGLIAFEILLDVAPRTAGELPVKAPEARP